MTKHKLIPVQLPLDRTKAHLYRTRSGLTVKKIADTNRTEFSDGNHWWVTIANGLVEGGNRDLSEYDITHELAEETMTKIDWSDTIDKLVKEAHIAANEPRYFPTETFRNAALKILQQFAETHKLAPKTEELPGETHKLDETAEQLEFVAGEKYDYKQKNYPMPDWRTGELIAFNDAHLVLQREGGEFKLIQRNNMLIRKHAPEPKKHKVSLWMNVYGDRGGIYYYSFQNKTKADADKQTLEVMTPRLACLHIEREFYEGEGL